ncbi:hypothetical protein [Caulobacter sp. DWR3-1-2]|uniref:hypothetical protein n=1 Tax=Caulobacter sp. DWR3-1-2 TaxID=2804647 RepID=UPI003CE996CB
MSAVIGALRVVLGMDTAQFEAGAEKGRKAASGLQNALGGFSAKFAAVASGAAIGTAAVAAFSTGMKLAAEAAQYADDIAAQSYKLGVSAEYLQKFNYAAEASDVPLEAAGDALLGLSAAIGALQTRVGDGKLRKAMEALGITQAQIQSFRSAEDALPVLADKISKLGTVTEQLQFAKKFGIEALLPMMKEGAAGIQGLMNRAEGLGFVLSNGVIGRLADMNERLRVADEQARAAGRGLGASFTPALVAMKEAAVDGIKWLDHLIDRFNKLGDRSTATLEKQISEKREKLRQQVIHGAGDSGMADYLRGEISQLEEAMRNNNRAAMRRKTAERAAAAPAGAVGDYGGGGGSGSAKSASAPSASDLAAARAKADGRVAGPSPEEMWGTADWVSNLDPIKTVSVEDVVPLKEIKAGVTESVSDGGLAGHLDALTRAKTQLAEGFQYAIGGGLYAAIHGGGKGLMQWLASQFEQSFVEGVGKALGNVLANAGSSGKGGWLSSIASAAATVFGVGQNANGTTNWRGGLTLVGERGAELLNVPRGSQITPAHALSGLGSGQAKVALSVTPSRYFDVAVQSAAQPMVEQYSLAAAEGGATLAETNMATRRRTTLGSGRR